MVSDDTIIKIYKHKSAVEKIVAHPDGDRCVTGDCHGAQLFSILSHECLTYFGDFDISGHSLLCGEDLIAITDSGQLSNRHLSHEHLGVKYVHPEFDCFADWIIPFGRNHFLAAGMESDRSLFGRHQILGAGEEGDRSQAVVFEIRQDRRGMHYMHTLSVCKSFGGVFAQIAACKYTFATAGPGSMVQVWRWNSYSAKFRRLRVLRPGFEVTDILLTEKFVISGSRDGYYRMYDTSNYETVQSVSAGFLTQSLWYCSDLQPVGADMVLSPHLCDQSLTLFDVRTFNVVWKKNFGGGVSKFLFLAPGKIIIGMQSGQVLLCNLPKDVVSQIENSGRFVLDRFVLETPLSLQDALSSCLSGHSSPVDHCSSLITYENCSVSFAEWCCAHQVLLLAVQNGDIKASTDYEGSIAHWFKNLYLPVKDLEITSTEDLAVAERYLREAKRSGLIEGVEAGLTALHVSNDIKEEVIPIVGGAAAGVLSVGANVVEGLSVKDIADYAFGLGSSLVEGEMASLGDRVFGKAAAALSPENIAKMNPDDLRRFEGAVAACGRDVNGLRQLFIESSSTANAVSVEDVSNGETREAEVLSVSEICDAVQTTRRNVLVVTSGAQSSTVQSRIEEARNNRPSDMEAFELSSAATEKMGQFEIAALCAAFIVRYNNSDSKKFVTLQERILHVLEDNDLDGTLICDRDAISSSEVTKIVVDGLNGDRKGGLTIGVERKLKQFFNKLQ